LDRFILAIFPGSGRKKARKYFPGRLTNVLAIAMRDILERTVFTVRRLGDAWAVEHEGEVFGHASDKEVAKAWAHKRAREVVDRGGAAQVCVHGEGILR
jgi:hypothetical protein